MDFLSRVTKQNKAGKHISRVRGKPFAGLKLQFLVREQGRPSLCAVKMLGYEARWSAAWPWWRRPGLSCRRLVQTDPRRLCVYQASEGTQQRSRGGQQNLIAQTQISVGCLLTCQMLSHTFLN